MMRFDNLDPQAARAAKRAALVERGINPYPTRVGEHRQIGAVRAEADRLQQEVVSIALAGRIKAWRSQGAITFADLHDETGKIQLLLRADVAAYADLLDLVDLGDHLFVEGTLTTTKRGELTLEVQQFSWLSKAMQPMPDMWHGLTDVEARQRQRYAELMVNDSVMERFRIRSRLTAAVRHFLAQQGFTEVETPVLEHVPGGADAEPFVTHHNALDTDFYLRISLELPLKRLLVGGFDKLFEIGRVFRNEGISPQHLQEFTMLEFYWAYADYTHLVPLVESLYKFAIEQAVGTLDLIREDYTLSFAGEWPRVTYRQLLLDYAGIDILEDSDDRIIEAIVHRGLKSGGGADQSVDSAQLRDLGRGRLLDMLYKKTARPHLIQPTWVLDLPVEFSPLTKQREDEPRLTERVVLVVEGAEVGNGYTELNDPIEQEQRFMAQEALRQAGDVEAQRLDTDFIRAMRYGMPPATGFGVGIDRLTMLVTGVESVRETVLFPLMRPEK
jgi:lysyl-tRNA synthetase class 2